MEILECPECGEEMEFHDSFSFSFDPNAIVITEWICPNCGKIESDEPPFEE
jgi:predicted RNA-binding Zn-ribbon protein involved in translation (DUF1610 family)